MPMNLWPRDLLYHNPVPSQIFSPFHTFIACGVCSRLLTLAHANYVPFRAFTYLLGPLHVPFRALLTFAHVCSRLLTFAHVCSRISSSWSIHVLFRAWDLKKYMVQHDIRAFLLGPQTLKSTPWLLVAMYLLGPLFAEIAKTLQSRSLDFQGNIIYIYSLKILISSKDQ